MKDPYDDYEDPRTGMRGRPLKNHIAQLISWAIILIPVHGLSYAFFGMFTAEPGRLSQTFANIFIVYVVIGFWACISKSRKLPVKYKEFDVMGWLNAIGPALLWPTYFIGNKN